MGVKFFGQFLIETGEIDAAQLRSALDLLDENNRSIGEIAIQRGLLTEKDAQRINQQQLRVDQPFGDLAVSLGLLDHQGLVECLREQRESRLMIGEALAQQGALPGDRLGGLLDAFKSDQEQYRMGVLGYLPDQLVNNRIAPYVLDLLPKFATRVARISMRIGEPTRMTEGPNYAYRISLPVYSHRNLEIALLGDHTFCNVLAAGMAFVPAEELDEEYIRDGVGEFLNVICGNAVGALDRDGITAELGVPDYNAELGEGWYFELLSSQGRAGLVLGQF